MTGLLLILIYICFISLGLPDSLLGSSWPVLHKEINVPISYVGIISMIIFIGTIISSLLSDKLLRKFGAGTITAISISLTAIGLLGFAFSNKFLMLILSSIPYGLGAGGVDAILNNYVATHYKPQHMSWLHCMWGLGASISPYIMSFSLVNLESWNYGYLIVSIIQIILSVFIFFSIPIWKKSLQQENKINQEQSKPLTLKEIFATRGALPCFFTFFAYCALELTTSLWVSSYLVQKWDIKPEVAACFASLFYLGITTGRFVNGFLAMKWNDHFLIRMGCAIIIVGLILLFIQIHSTFTLVGFLLIGLGCAPIYPCIIHMTPSVFGEDKSQAMIGLQMAFAYTGFLIMPPLFGVIAEYISIEYLPLYLSVLLITMLTMHELVARTHKPNPSKKINP